MISFEKSVGGVVFRRQGSTIMYLLLHYRPSDKPLGHWDFPKGHQEKGETEIETMERELKEETGLKDLQTIWGFKSQVRYFYRAGRNEKEERKKSGENINILKRVVYYLAETKNKNVKISFEHTGYEWLGYGDALKRITYKNSREILKKAHNYLNKNTIKQ